MSYTYRIFDSPDKVNSADWDLGCQQSAEPFTDMRFLRAVSRSMGADVHCWPLAIYDGPRLVAATCLSMYRIDGALLASCWVRHAIRAVRWLWSGCLRFRVLFCGLPVSAGQKTFFVAQNADRSAVVTAVDDAIEEIARCERTRLIVWKEFDAGDCQWLDILKERGYLRADSLPMNCFSSPFGSFEEYLASRGRRSRHNIRRSLRRIDEGGLRVEHRRGDEGVDEIYTDEVHQLYLAVVGHSSTTVEQLPAEFFREIARQFGRDAHFTFVYQKERIVAFSCCLATPREYHMMFLGMDYSLNAKHDLYFNVVYADFEEGMRQGVEQIRVGQNSSKFKARLGCYQVPLYVYAKGRGFLQLLLHLFSPIILPSVECEQDQGLPSRTPDASCDRDSGIPSEMTPT